MLALPSWLITLIWDQCQLLLPVYKDSRPPGCHRPRIPTRLVFDTRVQLLVFGCAYQRIADATWSATPFRRRRDAWVAAGVMDKRERIVLATYDRMIGFEVVGLAVDGCITKVPSGGEVEGRSPLDRAKQGMRRSTVQLPVPPHLAGPANTLMA